jgi:hypothetical protein
MSAITDKWLQSLAFFHPMHLPDGVLEIRTCGYELRTWQYVYHDRRQWVLNGLAVHPTPETRKDVEQLLRRLRR